jgi:hypothetical protein
MRRVIWLQTPTESFLSAVECTWGKDVRQTEIHMAEPLVPKPNVFEIRMATEKFKRKSHQVLIKFQQN